MEKHTPQSTFSVAGDGAFLTEFENGPDEDGTQLDKTDMRRMGKKQQLKRNFRFLSIFGFTMVLMATWEAQLR